MLPRAGLRIVVDSCARSARLAGRHVGHVDAPFPRQCGVRAAATAPAAYHALIQGASRGLGLEIASQLLARPNTRCARRLFECARGMDQACGA